MEDLGRFLIEEALILVPVLWILGKMLKNSTLRDNFIPWILLAAGIGFSVALLGADVDSVIQGILVAGMAVFGHQLVKQTGSL